MIDDLKTRVKQMFDSFIDKAGLLGLANLVKSTMVNLELSDEDKVSAQSLYDELMEAERITEIPDET